MDDLSGPSFYVQIWIRSCPSRRSSHIELRLCRIRSATVDVDRSGFDVSVVISVIIVLRRRFVNKKKDAARNGTTLLTRVMEMFC